MKKSEPTPAHELKVPEVPTWTDAEVQKVADFVNFVWRSARFDMSCEGFAKLQSMLKDMHAHISKLEQYVFEIKKVIQSPKRS